MENIEITNARQNNLKNISIKIPKYKIVVLRGVSGSGKSSLVLKPLEQKHKDRLMKPRTALSETACSIMAFRM